MKKYFKDILKLIIFLLLGIFFIWLSLKDLTQEQRFQIWINMKNMFTGYQWIYLVLCALIGVFSVVFRSLRSVLMLEPMGYRVRKSNTYHSIMICYLANLAIHRLGEILRCTVMQKYEKVPFQKIGGTVVTERIIDLIICGLMFVFSFILESEKLIEFFTESYLAEKIMNMLTGVEKYILITIFLSIVLIIYLLRNKIARFSIVQKIKSILIGFWEGIISVKDIKKPFLFVIYSLLIWVCYYLMFYVATFAYPDILQLGVNTMLLSLSCVVIGTFGFIIAQGGLGAYPLLIAMVFALYGISKEIGLSIGWVVWSVETATYVIFGTISLIIISLKK